MTSFGKGNDATAEYKINGDGVTELTTDHVFNLNNPQPGAIQYKLIGRTANKADRDNPLYNPAEID